MHYLSSTINVMAAASQKASRNIMRDFRELTLLQSSKRPLSTFIEGSIKRAEDNLLYALNRARPSFSIISENHNHINNASDPTWIVAPIEGITNFARGIPYFCMSIALETTNDKGAKEITAGVVHAPALGSIYFAETGKGAWQESSDTAAGTAKNRIRVSERKESLLVASNTIDIPKNILGPSAIVHVQNSCAISLAYLASGNADVCFLSAFDPTHVAASIIIAAEAGAKFKGLDLSLPGLKKQTKILGTNGEINLD